MKANPGVSIDLPATDSGAKPGDYPIGSLESRAVARGLVRLRRLESITTVVIWTGLPEMSDDLPIVSPPDTLEYYRAPDDSIVEVICREWAPGKFTAFINQTWADGSEYHGNHRVEALSDLEKFCLPE